LNIPTRLDPVFAPTSAGGPGAVRQEVPLLGTEHEVTLRSAVAGDSLCLSVLAMQVYLDTYARHGIRPSIARDVLDTFTQSHALGWQCPRTAVLRQARLRRPWADLVRHRGRGD
jgi:hypothetical protein